MHRLKPWSGTCSSMTTWLWNNTSSHLSYISNSQFTYGSQCIFEELFYSPATLIFTRLMTTYSRILLIHCIKSNTDIQEVFLASVIRISSMWYIIFTVSAKCQWFSIKLLTNSLHIPLRFWKDNFLTCFFLFWFV